MRGSGRRPEAENGAAIDLAPRHRRWHNGGRIELDKRQAPEVLARARANPEDERGVGKGVGEREDSRASPGARLGCDGNRETVMAKHLRIMGGDGGSGAATP